MNGEELLAVAPFSWTGILCAIISGAIIGTERQLLGKPVGIRTSALICLGTYIFVVIGESVAGPNGDPARVVGQVITGIGFLGAGVMLNRDGMVLGVTSAAAIWMLAAIGVVIGSGHEFLGVKFAFLAIVILVGVDLLENSFKSFQRGVHSKVVVFRERRNHKRPSLPTDSRE